jgi:hypothetical protein
MYSYGMSTILKEFLFKFLVKQFSFLDAVPYTNTPRMLEYFLSQRATLYWATMRAIHDPHTQEISNAQLIINNHCKKYQITA